MERPTRLGDGLYREIAKMAVPAMPIDRQATTFIPMVLLSDLKDWLDTLEIRIAPGNSLSQRIDVLYHEVEDE